MSRASALPTKLGRDDVFRKRKREGIVAMTRVAIVVGRDGVADARLAKKMERSQDYAVRQNRPGIFLECVNAWRASSSSSS